MITKIHIDEYIEIQNRGNGIGGHGMRPKVFTDIKNYNKLDVLFSRMILEKNTNVSQLISDKTKQLILNSFDSEETYLYFKKYVYWFTPNKKYITQKPWWKFWIKKTVI